MNASLQTLSLNLSTIKTIPLPFFLFFIAMLTGFTLYFFYQWYKSFIHKRVIQDIPTAKIHAAAQGYVELRGIQHCRSTPIIAPLSQSPCTWYRYTIERLVKRRWILLERSSSTAFFRMTDKTGECFIDPTGAQITTTLHESWLGFRRHPTGKPTHLLAKIISIFGHYRYQEWRMEEGMPLYVAANFRSKLIDNHMVNVLSGEGLSKRDPFILSARTERKIVRAFTLDAIFWFMAYMTVFILLGGLLIIRFA